MRNKNTKTKEFRELTYEISLMLGYEAMRNLDTVMTEIETPLVKDIFPLVEARNIALVPILRAGLAMSDAISDLMPTARIGHIGMYRDPITHKAVEYFCKLPSEIQNCNVFMLDPMLATGSSAIAAINLIKEKGVQNITFVSILSAPEGIKALNTAHPDVIVYTACVDKYLNADHYIIPGLGDAGDRIFGTM